MKKGVYWVLEEYYYCCYYELMSVRAEVKVIPKMRLTLTKMKMKLKSLEKLVKDY